MKRWWHLPGPSGFVSQVVNDLRDGRNVVLCLPKHCPDGLAANIRGSFSENEWGSWVRFSARTTTDVSPARQLTGRFLPDAKPDSVFTAGTLAQAESFSDHLIWLEGLCSANWEQWREFLIEYDHACRTRPLLGRTLFLVGLVGELALAPPPEDICLAVRCLRGYVDHLDTLLFAASAVRTQRLDDLQRRLGVTVMANLAVWDPEVVERLAAVPLATILEPTPVLAAIAAERGWKPGQELPSWHQGSLDSVNGTQQTHSAALTPGAAEIRRRIWSAEVSVLFPHIEEQRQAILQHLSPVLTVPFTTRFGVITNLEDLEIGHIEGQIVERNIVVSTEIRRQVAWLRQIRNALAHLEALDPQLVLSAAVWPPWAGGFVG